MLETTITKQCSSCKEIKEASEFYKASKNGDGLQSNCKECNRRIAQKFMKKFRDTDEGKERSRQASYEYRHSEKGLQASREAYKKHRIKKVSSACVRNRIKYGLLPHPSTLVCAICQEKQGTQYHHYKGYNGENRYNVIPVCTLCHSHIHCA